MIDRKIWARGQAKKRENNALKAVLKRAALLSGLGEPSIQAIEKYLGALTVLEDELKSKYGDLGFGLNSAAGKLQTEKRNALILLTKMKLQKIKPGDRL